MTAMTTPKIDRTHPTDDELMARLVGGAADAADAAVTALRARYQRVVRRTIRAIVHDRHATDDVAQEVFLKVFLHADQYQPGTCFRAWVLGIARNQALSALRHRRRAAQPVGSLELDRDAANDGRRMLEGAWRDQGAEERELMQAFTTALAELPARYRDVFQECVIEGRPYRDVAREFDLPLGTVAIRIMRARKQLFGKLSRHLGRLRRPPACLQSAG